MSNKNLGQFITHLATKAGMDSNNPDLINLLSNAELTKITVHSDIEKAIDENLLSLDTAKDNHPTLKNHYQAQTLNALDRKIESLLDGSGLPEDKIAEIKAIKSTYSRNDAFVEAIQAAALAKGKGASTEDKSALQKQVDETLLKLQEAGAHTAAEVARVEALRKQDRVKYELKAMLGSEKTIFDTLPPAAKQSTLDSIINTALQDKKAEFDFDGDNFILRGPGDTAVVGANQTKYTPKSFIDEILAQNKVLQVTNTATTQAATATPGVTTITANQPAITGNNQTTSNLNKANRLAQTQ